MTATATPSAPMLSAEQNQRLQQLRAKYGGAHAYSQILAQAEAVLHDAWEHDPHGNFVAAPRTPRQAVVTTTDGVTDCSCGSQSPCPHRMAAWVVQHDQPYSPRQPSRQDGPTSENGAATYPVAPYLAALPRLDGKIPITKLYQRFRTASTLAPTKVLPGAGRKTYYNWNVAQEVVDAVSNGYWNEQVVRIDVHNEQTIVTVGITIRCHEDDLYREGIGAEPLTKLTTEGKEIRDQPTNCFHNAHRRAFKRALTLYGFHLPDDD